MIFQNHRHQHQNQHSRPSLLVVLFSVAAVLHLLLVVVDSCQVTLEDGTDVTSDFFIAEHEHELPYVDCTGTSKCKNARIENCPRVKCVSNEACNSAQIINVTHTVECDGVHSCHTTDIFFATKPTTATTTTTINNNSNDDDDYYQSVMCTGPSACDVTHIVGHDIDLVSCMGVRACRKAHIEGPKLVKCHEGKEDFVACQNFATIDASCLYCGRYGCHNRVNQCRYKILDTSMDRYEKCQPESVVGRCPDNLKKELELELMGQIVVDSNVEDEEEDIGGNDNNADGDEEEDDEEDEDKGE